MTDEMYIYRSDINERSNVAKLSKNRLHNGKCTLPSDSISHWAKKKKNGSVIIMSPDRPILYDDFAELCEDSQRKYLQSLIDNHGGTTERIAKMWNVSEATVKNHRQTLGVKSAYMMPRDNTDQYFETCSLKWTEFLCFGDFLKEPMSYAEFKKLSDNEKRWYLNYIQEELDGSPSEIADMFEIFRTSVYSLYKKYGISSNEKGHRYSHVKWNEWLKKYNANCGVHQTDVPEDAQMETNHTEVTDTEQQPIVIRESEIPYLNLIMTVKSYEQIFEVLKTIPRAEKGTITFTFGEEEKE